jgi:ABC-type polysaccharide/polyol phosphate transport system ATPase subunit
MTSQPETAIRLEHVHKTFTIRDRPTRTIRESFLNVFRRNTTRRIHALKDISLEVLQGEFLGVIGRNGSGKSTLLQVMSGAYLPDPGGRVHLNGRAIRLVLGMGFNDELTCRQNVYINASVMGLTLKRIGSVFWDILAFAELTDYADTPIKFLSSGLRARLQFSVALYAQADIFFFDEFFAAGGVGDRVFQQKCERLFEQRLVTGKTVVLVTHSMDLIRRYSDRALLMHQGAMRLIGDPQEVVAAYEAL